MPRTPPADLTALPSLYAISDFRDGWPPAEGPDEGGAAYERRWRGEALPSLSPAEVEAARQKLRVVGGYMERLPLACVRHGLVDRAEKWHYWLPAGLGPSGTEQPPLFGWRAFHLRDDRVPFRSEDMLAFLSARGAPHVLCSYGLGVHEDVLDACTRSFKIYYSIDAPPIRVPPEVAGRFDLILVGCG